MELTILFQFNTGHAVAMHSNRIKLLLRGEHFVAAHLSFTHFVYMASVQFSSVMRACRVHAPLAPGRYMYLPLHAQTVYVDAMINIT